MFLNSQNKFWKRSGPKTWSLGEIPKPNLECTKNIYSLFQFHSLFFLILVQVSQKTLQHIFKDFDKNKTRKKFIEVKLIICKLLILNQKRFVTELRSLDEIPNRIRK